MFHFLIVLYGLSLAEAYNIRISGKVELGKELSRIFKEAYSEFGGVLPTVISNTYQSGPLGSTEDATTDKVSTEYNNNKLNNNVEEAAQDLSVLDKMVQNEQEIVHLYGNHKVKEPNDGGPLNNVHLRSL